MIGLAGTAVSSTSMGPIFGAALFTGPAAPFIMAASALVQPLTKIIKGMIQGCGQSCVEATKYADTAETHLKQLVAYYLSQPQRCRESQTATLQYIDGVLQWLDNGCRAVGGDAGRRCISERLVKGGSAPWCPKPGGVGCDWITLYRDPVANDLGVSSCGSIGGVIGDLTGGLVGGNGGGGNSTMLLLVVLAVVIVLKKRKG